MYWLYKHRQLVLYVIVVAAIAVGGYLLYQHFHPPNMVTPMSQQQAETPQGVQQAADQAQVNISQAQAAEIATEIREAPARQPDRVVETTGAQLAKTVEAERQKAGADFAIVTDPAQPTKVPVLDADSLKLSDIKDKYSAPVFQQSLNPDTPLTVNSYLIKAYPQRMWDLTAFPDSCGKIKAADAAIKWRIGKTDAYIGPAFNYDEERKRKLRPGIRLSGTF